jgi:leucyl aminopeptidase
MDDPRLTPARPDLAAKYLEGKVKATRFVTDAKSWLHVDIYGWTPSAKPARPEGGECQAARAIYKLLSERYG